MAYSKQFKDEDILNAMDTEPRTTSVIARRVGCSRNTAITFLQKLEGEGKVKKIVIEGGTTTWVIINIDFNVEEPYEQTLEDLVYSYQQKHLDDELAKKVYEFIIQQMNPWRTGQYIVWEYDFIRESIRKHFSSAIGKPRQTYKG